MLQLFLIAKGWNSITILLSISILILSISIVIITAIFLKYRKENDIEKLKEKINVKYDELSLKMLLKMILSLRKMIIEETEDCKNKKFDEKEEGEIKEKIIEKEKEKIKEKLFHFVTHLKPKERFFLNISTSKSGEKLNYNSITSIEFNKKPNFQILNNKFDKEDLSELGFTQSDIEIIKHESNRSK